jgi:microsomal dipeptidase-like Zn-dependent dipeptidase
MNQSSANTNLAQSIARSFAEAGAAVESRRARLGALIELRAGTQEIRGFSKLVIGADIFWTNGRKNLTTGQLIETLGTKLVKAGIVSSEEFYS